MSSLITVEQIEKALPSQLKRRIEPMFVERVNQIITEPEVRETYRNNLISYMSVMRDGKFTVEQYLNAIHYVTQKLMNKTNKDAYAAVFPEKMARFAKEQVSDKDIASYVSAYNKSKLVNLILEQSLIPVHLLNADLYQQALNTQAELMLTARSEKVRSDAANSILTQLKPPETRKIELDMGMKQDQTIAALQESTMALVAQQKQAMQAGVLSAQDVAVSKLVIDADQ